MCGEEKNIKYAVAKFLLLQLSKQSETFANSCGVCYQIEENMMHENMYHSV
jgi:hypothetical protein